jgi:hypothetical protein
VDNNIEIKLRKFGFSFYEYSGAYVVEIGIDREQNRLCIRCSKPEEQDAEDKENHLMEYGEWSFDEKKILELLLGPIAQHKYATGVLTSAIRISIRDLPTLKQIPLETNLYGDPWSIDSSYFSFTGMITSDDFGFPVKSEL